MLLQTQFRMDPDLSTLNTCQRGGRLTDADFDDIHACAIGAPEKHASIHHPILRKAHFIVLRHTVGGAIFHDLLPRRAAEDHQQLIRWSAKDMMCTCRNDAWTPVTIPLPPRPPRALDTQQDGTRSERDVLLQRHAVHIPA
jgi:hypothetical protein